MFIVLLSFAENKGQAAEYMDGHNAWIKQGMDDGIFILVGSLQPDKGGAIIAHQLSYEDLQNRLGNDPFVKQGVVSTEILEITPAKADERLGFLMT